MAAEVHDWLERRVAKIDATPSLEAALLTGRTARYLVRRLSLVLPVQLLAYALHLVELAVLGALWGPVGVVKPLMVALSSRIVVAAAWSTLEIMRSRLRAARDNAQAQRIASSWLSFSFVAAVALLAVGMAVVQLLYGTRAYFAALYSIAYILRAAIDLVVQTYYSTAYAHGRVYRPRWAIWFPQVFALVALLGSVHLLGQWGLSPLGLIIGMLLGIPLPRVLMAYYTTRAHRAARRPLPRLALRGGRVGRLGLGELVLAIGAGALTELGALAFFAVTALVNDLFQVVFLFLLAPVLTTVGNWARVFYPDLVRLQNLESERLHRKLVYALTLASVVLATFWLLVVQIIGKRVFSGWVVMSLPPMIWLLLPSLSLVSVWRNVALARGRYGALIAMGGLLSIVVITSDEVWLPVVCIVGAVVVGAWLALGRAQSAMRLPRAIARAPLARVLRSPLGGLRSAVRRELETRLTHLPMVTHVRRTPRWLYWIHAGTAMPDAQWLVLSGGLGGKLEIVDEGKPALMASALDRAVIASNTLTEKDVLAAAQTRLAEATVIAVGGSRRVPIAPQVAAAVWTDAMAFVTGSRRPRSSELDVTAWAPRGVIELVFIVSKDVDGARRIAWRHFLRSGASRH